MIRPNLILMTVECWRSDYFTAELTPCLHRLGNEATVFRDAQASGGWTLPAMTAMMSSAHASLYGGCADGLKNPQRLALAEELAGVGYHTAGISTNIVCGGNYGFNRGFHHFVDARRKPAIPSAQLPPKGDDRWRQLVAAGIPPHDLDAWCTASDLTREALLWLRTLTSGEPFFLWLHFMDTHCPYVGLDRPTNDRELYEAWYDRHLYQTDLPRSHGTFDPGPERRERWTSQYRQAVSLLDAEIGLLLDEFRSRPDWDRTILAVTGDHGEELYDHGRWHHSWSRLHREGIQVPLILRIPGALPATLAQPVSHLDLAPTLLDYAAVVPSHNSETFGRSLKSLVERGDRAPVPGITEMMAHPDGSIYLLAIRDGGWKYIYDFEDPHHSRLFHEADDPGEERDLREVRPDVFREFEKKRLAHVSRTTIQPILQRRSETAGEMSDLMKEQMVALGYLAE